MKYRSLYNDNVIETQKIRYTNCYYCGKRVELLRAGIEKKINMVMFYIYVKYIKE